MLCIDEEFKIRRKKVMKKKMVGMLLCVAMVVSLIAGCGNGGADKEGSKAEDVKKADDLSLIHI